MSHVTQVSLRVKNLDALEEAAKQLGLELRRGQRTHAWWGSFVGDSTPPKGRDPKDYGKCEHAIGRAGTKPRSGSSGEWEIGVVKALDGDGFDLMLDEFGSSGERLMATSGGHGLPKLRQEYAAAVAVAQARKKLAPKGFTVQREAVAGGRIRIKVVKR